MPTVKNSGDGGRRAASTSSAKHASTSSAKQAAKRALESSSSEDDDSEEGESQQRDKTTRHDEPSAGQGDTTPRVEMLLEALLQGQKEQRTRDKVFTATLAVLMNQKDAPSSAQSSPPSSAQVRGTRYYL